MTNGDSKKIIDDLEQDLKAEVELDKKMLGPLYEDGGLITITKCPKCESEERIFGMFYDYLVRHGKAKAGKMTGSNSSIQIFGDPIGGLIGTKVPTFLIIRDICRKCGLEYPVLIKRQDGPMPIQNLPKHPPMNR